MSRHSRTLPALLATLFVAGGLPPVLRAADDPPEKPLTAGEARQIVAKAVTGLYTQNADDFEETLDPGSPTSRYAAGPFLQYARAKHTFLLVAQARFGPKEGAALDPEPMSPKDLDAFLALLNNAPVWIDEYGKQALVTPVLTPDAPTPGFSQFHLVRSEEEGWTLDAQALLPEDHHKTFEIRNRLETNALALNTISEEMAAGKLATPAAVTARYDIIKWSHIDLPPEKKNPEPAKPPAAFVGEKTTSFKTPREALGTFLNAIRTNDSAAAREALASPDSDEGHALEALFLRCVCARAIRGAAFDAFGEVALPLDPFNLADDEFLTPSYNASTWLPTYFRPGTARISISLGTLPLTFLFTKSGDDWKIDPAPTLKINAIDPMPDATMSVMRVKAKADFDFAQQIKDKKFPTWRDARSARRTQN